MSDLSELGRILLIYGLALPRLLMALVLLPAFSSVIISGMLRNGVAASMTLFLLPVVLHQAPPEELSVIAGGFLFLKEFILGLLLGFGAAVIFWAVESTGFLIDNHRGSSMASSLDPLTGSQTSPLGNLFAFTFTAIFFAGGGFVAFLAVLYQSYAVWPLFSFYPHFSIDAVPYFLGLFDKILFLTVVVGAPVIIAMFLSEFALALISRFAPQLNVFFLAMPIKSAIGILLLVLYFGTIMRFYSDQLIRFAADFEALQLVL